MLTNVRSESPMPIQESRGSMTAAQRRYLAVETVIGAIINAILSAAFVFIVFGGHATVPVWGPGGLVLDAVPQTLMVSLMSMLVPGLLTRKRLIAGKVNGAALATVGTIVRRSILVAVLLAGALTGLQSLLFSFGPPRFPFGVVLAAKVLYGAILGAAVAGYGVRRLLVGVTA